MYDVHNPKKPRALGSAGRFYEAIGGAIAITIRTVRVNSDGSRVSLIVDLVEGSLKVRHPDTKLYVYDRMKGNVSAHDFSQYKRYPVSMGWDTEDCRMLACEAVRMRTNLASSTSSVKVGTPKVLPPESSIDEDDSEVEVYTLFASSDRGVLMQDSFPRRSPFGAFLGMSVPKIYFRNAPNMTDLGEDGSSSPNAVKILSKVMRDFVGMEDANNETRTALLDFSYNLTLGKLDEAYRSVKMIGNPALWENMAHMCVKTKRLDVAEVCLGNMGHVRGVAAVRESKKENSLEVSIGVLAIQLGLYDDAVKLFQEGNRPDLITNLYSAAGLWDKSIKVATSQDRVHLNNTHYKYAQHLESIGDIDGAIKNYKVSDTYRTEVFQTQLPSHLSKFQS